MCQDFRRDDGRGIGDLGQGDGMNIRFHEKLYIDDISDKKIASIKKKIKRGFPKLNLYLITLPIGNQGILEVYWYPELLQNFYRKRKKELIVVGLAGSKEGAFEIIQRMITEIGLQGNKIPVDEFFKESG